MVGSLPVFPSAAVLLLPSMTHHTIHLLSASWLQDQLGFFGLQPVGVLCFLGICFGLEGCFRLGAVFLLWLTERCFLFQSLGIRAAEHALRQENCQGQEGAYVLGGLPGFHAAALLLRVVAVALEELGYRCHSVQASNEARVMAVGSRLIQKSLLR